MIRRILLLVTMVTVVFTGALPAFADKRVALIVGNSNYKNVARLENPKNDATLMASTLRDLGFQLVGNGPQLDLDKQGLDRVIQTFSKSLQGADVAMFYYAGHGVQVRGSNYLVPVNANPTREADVDFQMVDVNLVLRQMEGSGTKLNLVLLDACRNNPFGVHGLRAADGGLAQMRAPEGTLISFATQPGSVALDGTGNSPYTKALAATIRKGGLDIFQTFNQVGLAVKRETNGSQQPWVSSSPIDGNFYFKPPVNNPAQAGGPGPDDAALAWTAIRDTNSIAVIDTFIRQYGNSLYGPFARARRDELSKKLVAANTPALPNNGAPNSTAPSGAVPNSASPNNNAAGNPASNGKQAPNQISNNNQPAGNNQAPNNNQGSNKPFADQNPALKNSQIASNPPAAATKSLSATPREARLSMADVAKLLAPLELAVNKARANYVDPIDDRDLYGEAIRAMQTAFPTPQQVSSTEPVLIPTPKSNGGKSDINSVYEAALEIANAQPSDAEDLHIVRVAVNGALASLDPHSGYLDAKAAETRRTRNSGQFAGIGIEVNMQNGLLKVVAPNDEGPAFRGGILAGDVIIGIDDKSIQGLNLTDSVALLRGPLNSQIKLKLLRRGQQIPVEMTLTREIVHTVTVRWHVEQDDIGYVRLTKFDQQTDNGFRQAIDGISSQLAGDKLKGYIIDLRNSGGGLVAGAVSVADDVLDAGEIYSIRTRKGASSIAASRGDLTGGKRIVVLINGGSAGAAEILAGALKDNKRATLVGTRSFGGGSIQSLIELGGDNGAINLTTARNFTPLGNSIQATGIEPDVTVLQNEPDDVKQKAVPYGEATLAGHLPGKGAEEIASQSYVPRNPADDLALAKAVELLHTAQAQVPSQKAGAAGPKADANPKDAPAPQADAPRPKFKRWNSH
jgi:carboxyl-terminal processing protease